MDADSPEEEETTATRCGPAATLGVWESLLAPRGYTKVRSKLVKAGPAEVSNSTLDPSLPQSGKKKDKENNQH
jgi:hypothetical protein